MSVTQLGKAKVVRVDNFVLHGGWCCLARTSERRTKLGKMNINMIVREDKQHLSQWVRGAWPAVSPHPDRVAAFAWNSLSRSSACARGSAEWRRGVSSLRSRGGWEGFSILWQGQNTTSPVALTAFRFLSLQVFCVSTDTDGHHAKLSMLKSSGPAPGPRPRTHSPSPSCLSLLGGTERRPIGNTTGIANEHPP